MISNVRMSVKLTRVRITTVAVDKKQVLHIPCVSAAFVIQHAKRMCRIISPSVAYLAVPYFSTLYHKRHVLPENVLEQKIWVLIFRTTFSEIFLEIFLFIRIIHRYIINVHRYHVKYPLFLSDVNETWIFSKDFQKILKYQISWKSVQWEPSC